MRRRPPLTKADALKPLFQARAVVAQMIDVGAKTLDFPAIGDQSLLLSEVFGNAGQHSPGGRPAGRKFEKLKCPAGRYIADKGGYVVFGVPAHVPQDKTECFGEFDRSGDGCRGEQGSAVYQQACERIVR